MFGPTSVTWRVFASPSTAIGTATAVLAQMLHPRVVRLIAQASTFERNPELRARLTAEYGATITFGDTALAEQAGATLRNLHLRMKAVDINTGEEYDANEPDLLTWALHHSLGDDAGLRALGTRSHSRRTGPVRT